ncbi:MAG: hypothetical protein JXQ76_00280 [Campylobacterales bacterium]|nr:hypothetical protein [Campylobacterales bacterium]
MKIEDILNLTNGELMSTPSIKAVEGVTLFPSKIERGDLFVGNDQNEIDKALEDGAYGVIYDDSTIVPKDSEIAWIKVDSIYEAAFRIVRYVILTKEAEFYYLNAHEMSFAKMIITQKSNIAMLFNDWKKAFEQIVNSDGRLFVGSNVEMMRMIKPDMKILSKAIDGYMMGGTLFKSTFKIEKFIYQEKEFAPFHFDTLARVIAFCEQFELPYSIDRIKYTQHFMPIFINNDLTQTNPKNSDQVIIFVDNIEDIIKAREFIKYNGQWIKSIVLTPPNTKISEFYDNPHWFSDASQAIEILKNTHFNYAFVYTLDKSILKNIKAQYSLFDL